MSWKLRAVVPVILGRCNSIAEVQLLQTSCWDCRSARWTSAVCIHRGRVQQPDILRACERAPVRLLLPSLVYEKRPCSTGEHVLLSFCSYAVHICSVESSFKAVLQGNRMFSWCWNSLFWRANQADLVPCVSPATGFSGCNKLPSNAAFKVASLFLHQEAQLGLVLWKELLPEIESSLSRFQLELVQSIALRYLYSFYIHYSSAYVRNAYVIPDVNS